MNIILIGMPGAGKSTIGARLAQAMDYDFIDTDELIKQRTGQPLQEIVSDLGVDGFIQKESQIIRNLFVDHYVIATGGSVVYCEETMRHLKKNGVVVYLKLKFPSVKFRIRNLATRGIAMGQKQDLFSLYQERTPLYEKFADVVVEGDRKQKSQMVEATKNAVEEYLLSKKSQ